jgi:large subunit ribosomal protein L5
MAKKSKASAGATAVADGPAPTPRLLEQYRKTILPKLKETLGRTNPMNLPRLQKIVVNMGVGSATVEKKHLEDAVASMTVITGQKPLVTKSKVAVAGFKLRENLPIGCKVTLRGFRMYEFMDRLINLVLPRVRDFRGLPQNAFDKRGNYSLGLSEQLVFPELNPDKFQRQQGMNITIVISGGSDDESRELLRAMGLPFRTEEPKKK